MGVTKLTTPAGLWPPIWRQTHVLYVFIKNGAMTLIDNYPLVFYVHVTHWCSTVHPQFIFSRELDMHAGTIYNRFQQFTYLVSSFGFVKQGKLSGIGHKTATHTCNQLEASTLYGHTINFLVNYIWNKWCFIVMTVSDSSWASFSPIQGVFDWQFSVILWRKTKKVYFRGKFCFVHWPKLSWPGWGGVGKLMFCCPFDQHCLMSRLCFVFASIPSGW